MKRDTNLYYLLELIFNFFIVKFFFLTDCLNDLLCENGFQIQRLKSNAGSILKPNQKQVDRDKYILRKQKELEDGL